MVQQSYWVVKEAGQPRFLTNHSSKYGSYDSLSEVTPDQAIQFDDAEAAAEAAQDYPDGRKTKVSLQILFVRVTISWDVLQERGL